MKEYMDQKEIWLRIEKRNTERHTTNINPFYTLNGYNSVTSISSFTSFHVFFSHSFLNKTVKIK